MKIIRVLIDHFSGSIERNGEAIKTADGTDPKKGDLVKVKDETWEAIQRAFPDWFLLISEAPQPIMDNPKMEFTEKAVENTLCSNIINKVRKTRTSKLKNAGN